MFAENALAACRRALCQELHSAATSKGLAAVAAEGTLAEIEAATADEQYQSLEKALPASAEDMAEVIAAHAQGGEQHRFATCQLMLLAGTCMVRATVTPGPAHSAGFGMKVAVFAWQCCTSAWT